MPLIGDASHMPECVARIWELRSARGTPNWTKAAATIGRRRRPQWDEGGGHNWTKAAVTIG
eukprot:275060-Chlamydomonas_euryale.AAC.2